VEGLLCNLVYARFDFRAKAATLANSGLPYPMHYRAADHGGVAVEVAGLPLGAFDGATYEERTLPLEPGDVFIFYTDGICDASIGGEEYGTERLRRLIETEAHRPAPDLGDRILADFDTFMQGSEPPDDVTLVVVKVL
jgi:sigma-B regulation protein RsbU (phosphoserine phosphatase)